MRVLIRQNGLYPKALTLIGTLALLVPPATSASAQNAANGEPQLVTKVYNVGDLIESPSMLEDKSDGSGNSGGASNLFGGGFGGGAGGGMQGGGFFRVPDNILPQFGGDAAAAGGGGMGGMMVPGSNLLPDHMSREALEDVLYDHLSGASVQWEEIDGVGGTLSIVGSMLIVTNTTAVHQQLSLLLDALRAGIKTSPNVQVDVRIVEVAPEQSVESLTSTTQSIEKLAGDQSAARLTLRCGNHRTANISSGLKRSYVFSLTPVVGSDGVTAISSRAVAYRPETYSALLGLFGRIKPEIEDDQKSGRIHLGIRLASGPDEVLKAEFGSGQSIDRVELETAQLETSVVTKAEQWTLAGNVAVTDPASQITSGAALPHLAILVRWKVVE